ncbi:MAG: thiamine diphosphokinase [Prevotella sp.]|nr:thiamine diphosphokinase [Prevotella sp.]
MRKFDAVILANGAFPTHAVPLKVLHEADRVVCCDGAITHYPHADIVIGDGDSVPPAYHDRLIQIDEQDDNDLTKATRYCIAQGWQRIAYLGCTGKREDHTLGNISLLMRYFKEYQVEGVMYTDHGFFVPAKGDSTFEAYPGQQVSIFNFGCTELSSEGLKWQCYPTTEWWQGTLNEALGASFTIHANDYYLAFRTFSVH